MKISDFLNQRVIDAVGRGKDGNVFGVELELEGRGVRMDGVAARGWRRTEDGSLRGESVEYVFSDPCDIKVAQDRVSNLFAKFKANGVDIKNSYRTSTHVHLNFGDKTVKQLLTFFTLFTMLEDILERYSGEDRAGNLFCLSSRRGEAIINVLSDAVLKHQNFRAFADDRYKYAACNLSTLYKFGTAEIRTMRGAVSAKQVNDWLLILDQLYVRALRAKNPIEFIENISILGPDGFLNDVFSREMKAELVRGLPEGFDFRCSLLEGARLCQVFAYDVGEEFDVEPAPRQVFDRDNPLMLPGPLDIARGGYRIYHPGHGAGSWNIGRNTGGTRLYFHGDSVGDDSDLRYDETTGRFVYNGIFCAWKEHPVFGNEARLVRANSGMIILGRLAPVFDEPEIDHDDYDEDDDF